MPTTFEFIRERLIEAGRTGMSQSELHRVLRTSSVARRDGTYDSFRYYFWVLKKLKWVIQTGRTERASRLPDVLSEKIFYRLTPLGRRVPAENWRVPQVLAYPQYAVPGRTRRYYTPTGRPRGRPRRIRRRRIAAEIVPAVAPVEVVVPAEVVEKVPRKEAPRIVRFPLSIKVATELEKLSSLIETLKTDPSELDNIERYLASLFDTASDAIDQARGEEKVRLQVLMDRLVKASEGVVEMQAGKRRPRGVTYLRGWEKLRTYSSPP